jgi:anthranilate synthase component 1
VNLAELEALAAQYNVIPLVRRLFSGTETPLGIYQKISESRPGSFLLESAEQGVWGRYSFIGGSSRGTLSERGGNAIWLSKSAALPEQAELNSEPIAALEQLQLAWRSAPMQIPLSSGLVGFIGWSAVSAIERLPAAGPADYPLPQLHFTQFAELVVMDHKSAELLLIANIFVDGHPLADALAKAESALDRLQRDIAKPTPAVLHEPSWPEPAPRYRTERADFLHAVERAKHHVRLGDVFQVVISQRFDLETTVAPDEVYRALRALNPSPYMYLMQFEDEQGGFAIVGASPEALVTVSDGEAVMHPIAGSRPRGKDAAADTALAEELLADHKEQSEHLMLVDLARNDLLKVCEPSTLRVSEFMQVHRFSHIMHLVSTVRGKLTPKTSAVSVFRATFPAGTLSGAPKPRALELIHELEPAARGLFGGVVGYFDFAGNADLAIAIRTALIRDGVARVQAGAGIVLDSVPDSEYAETEAKATVVLRAVAAANAMAKL